LNFLREISHLRLTKASDHLLETGRKIQTPGLNQAVQRQPGSPLSQVNALALGYWLFSSMPIAGQKFSLGPEKPLPK